MIKVIDHRLSDETITINYTEARRASVITPEVIVIHYGVTESIEALVGAQKHSGFVAHVSIDGYSVETNTRGLEYKVHQLMPLNERGSHAGKSTYRGRSSVNSFSIGIEISNPGPLIRGRDGNLRTTYHHENYLRGSNTPTWDEDQALEARHPSGKAPWNWTHWARYTSAEYDLLVEINRALIEAYPTITDIVGHEDISPGRKFDPGPAMDLPYLRKMAFS